MVCVVGSVDWRGIKMAETHTQLYLKGVDWHGEADHKRPDECESGEGTGEPALYIHGGGFGGGEREDSDA